MKRPISLFPILLFMIFLSACGTPLSGLPFGAPTLTATASLTPAPSITVTSPPTQTSTPLPADAISTFFVSINDNGYSHLFVFAPGRLQPTRITNGAWNDTSPALSPDGQKLVFASDRNDYWDLYLLDLATGQTARLTDTPEYDGSPSWSPDSQWVVYETYANDNMEVKIVSTVKAGQIIPLSNDPNATDSDPAWSPEGRKIAFVSNRSGKNEILVASLDKPDPRLFVNVSQTEDGIETHPAWSPDGTKLAWASARPNQPDNIYVWDTKIPDVPARRVGTGNWPIWNDRNGQIATRFHQANQDYLTAYNLDGTVTLPIIAIPTLHGIDWRTIRIAKLPVTFQKAALLTPTSIIKAQPKFDTPLPNKRIGVVQLDDVEAPHPALHGDVKDSFISLRQRVIAETGWDPLASLAEAYVPLTTTLDPGKGEDWLYTGRAFALNTLTLNVGWMTVVREDIDSQTYWRVYLRTLAQDGSQGEPLTSQPWDLNARYSLDPQAYDGGGALMASIPPGYWIDFTNLASQYGWQRIPAQNDWRTYFNGTQFNEFVLNAGLDWRSAMLQIYPPDIFVTPTAVVPPTATYTKTPIPYPFNSATPTQTATPSPHPTFTLAP